MMKNESIAFRIVHQRIYVEHCIYFFHLKRRLSLLVEVSAVYNMGSVSLLVVALCYLLFSLRYICSEVDAFSPPKKVDFIYYRLEKGVFGYFDQSRQIFKKETDEKKMLRAFRPRRRTLESSLASASLFFFLFAATTSPVMALDGDISRGETLFVNNCASCHVGGTNVIKPAKTLSQKDLEKNIRSAEQDSVQNFFQNSMQHKLLNFPKVEGGKLSEQQLVDVTTYISNQALENKW